MTKLVDLNGEREKRKELCVYCGEEAHPTPIACERIIGLDICQETGHIIGIEFSPFWRLSRTDPV